MATTTVGTIQLIATIDTNGYKRGASQIEKTNKDIETSTDSTSKKSEKSFLRMGAAIGVVAGVAQNLVSRGINAISNSLDNAIKRVDTFNNFPRVMENLGFESEEAAKQIDRLDKATRGLPTPLDRIVNAMQQIAPASKSMDEATDITLALNNALLASGKSTEEQAQAFNQFVQALGRGRPDLIELRSFAATAPGQFRQIAKALGLTATTADGVNEAFKDGTIDMQDFTDALVKLNKDGLREGGREFASFEKQARDATGGIGTAISRVRSSITRNIGNIILALGDSRITGSLDRMRTGIDQLGQVIVRNIPTAVSIMSEVFSVISKVVGVLYDLRVPLISLGAAFASYRAAIIATNAVNAIHATYLALVGTRYVMLNGQLIALRGATIAQTVAQTALNVVMNLNPMALVASTAAALASVFLLTRGRTDELKAAQDRLREATDAVKAAQDRLKDANLNAEGAALRVERAQKNYNDAVRQYGKDSLEAREAEYNLKRARDDQEQAIRDVITAQDELKKSNKELESAQKNVENQTKNTTNLFRLQRDELKKLQDETAKGLVGGGLKDGSFDLRNFGGFRANGGGVNPSNAYVVGEEGPELFVPKSSGNIIPNDQLQGSSQGDITINLQGVFATSPAEQRRVAEQIAQRLKEIQASRGLAGGIA